jgi:hypothetical protein
MDAKAVRKIVDKYELEIATLLGVQDWTRSYEYGVCSNPEWVASCDRKIDYKLADICINPDKMHSPEDVMSALVHELGHIMLAPMDVYRNVMYQFLPKTLADRVERLSWTHSIETTNVLLERAIMRMVPKLKKVK